jgi:aspartate dehydrogenase
MPVEVIDIARTALGNAILSGKPAQPASKEILPMAPPSDQVLRVGIGGLGAIGLPVARRLAQGMPGLALAAVAARDPAKAEARLAAGGIAVPIVTLAQLADRSDIVIETLPAASFRAIAEPAIDAGRVFLPLSVGALLDHLDLVERAKATGARIIVPTGALLGLDAVRAAAEGEIHSARLITRKPPAGLAGAPYLVERGISLAGLERPLKVFDGTAREGARGFPANVNVAAALALAGIGPDRTRLEIWADPSLARNTHRIEVEADTARFSMTIENVPSAENPRTGRLTPLSVIACLRGLTGTLRVGS